MKNKISLMLFLITFLSFAQNKFEAGYYIDNSGVKTECLIKNYEWKNNPKSIEIKNSQDESIIIKSIEEIKEFSIVSKSKYIRETIKMDESSTNINTLLSDPNPTFKEFTIFLKVLVEGSSNLYFYENKDYERYFYTKDNKIEQLVYLLYKKDGDILANNLYRQQLFVNFKCNNDSKPIESLDYNDELIEYFIKTNNCISGTNDAKIITEKRKFNINLKLNLLVNSNNQTYSSPFIKQAYESGNSTNLGFGFETEIILPYNNGNWSVVMDPYYYKFDKPLMDSKGIIKFENTINVFKIPLGVRRYFSINNNSKLFANAALNLNFSKTKIDEKKKNQNIDHDMYNSFNFSFGVGYQYKRCNMEIKFNPKTTIGGNQLIGEEYVIKQASLKLGYRIL